MNRHIRTRRAATAALLTGVLAGTLGFAAPSVAAPSSGTAPSTVTVPVGGGDHRPPTQRPVDPIAHDPTMVEESGWYYVAVTGDAGPDDTYIPMKRSRDLVHWQELRPVFTELEPWVPEGLGVTAENAPRDAWAPDLFWTGSEWQLYSSVSQFGTNNSVIGLMTSPTLARPDWEDQGLVVRSQPDLDAYNAIDPNVVVDAAGDTWLTFGSFFAGIHLVQLDESTGNPAGGAVPVQIAQRETPPHAAENPAIVFDDGLYYLFLSYDFCCRGLESDYRTVVGRSADVAGPYVDAEGLPARYVVVNDDSGKLLSSKCHGRSRDDLRVVEPRRADERCITWTLVPGDEGTWTLANPTTTQEVCLLVP